MAGERISTWGPDTMVRRRSRARPRGGTLGLARTRIFVSRTTLTDASYDAAEPATGLPEGQPPSLRRSSPGRPERPKVQVLLKVLGVPPVLTFKGTRYDLGKVAVGRHTSGARLPFKRGGILLRQVNCQVQTLLLQINPSQCAPGARPRHRPPTAAFLPART
jgi:hypothetical protein